MLLDPDLDKTNLGLKAQSTASNIQIFNLKEEPDLRPVSQLPKPNLPKKKFP